MKATNIKTTPAVSVIVPMYNEAGSLVMLHQKIIEALKKRGLKLFEVIFVDDGSTDATFEVARGLSPLKLIRFSENYGQTAALAAGIKAARGEIIITMDGDLENDPSDIGLILEKMDEGHDVVSGWREDRWRGKRFTRQIPSAIANKLISLITGVKLHDHGCTLKAYRRRFVESLHPFGDMHRMMAAYALPGGGRIAEVSVTFSERQYGVSKYGLSRTFKVLLDVLAFHFFRKYRNRPMHFFGWFGFLSLFAGVFTFCWMLALKLFEAKSFISTPLPVLTVFFVIIGVQFILMGLLAEVLIRTQYEREERLPYRIDEILEL